MRPIASPWCGIAYSGTSNSSLEHLPLQQTKVHAEIVDVSAVVTLTQIFWQYSSYPTGRAKYVFPIPARAAICAFEMRTEAGRVIKAVAKEKEQATQEHKSALRKGKMTGLVEHITDDIFTISLGALPGRQMITTTLTYVMNLADGDLNNQVRFQLPRSVGMRFGVLPSGMRETPIYAKERVKISASFQMSGTIRRVESPSHSLNTYSSADVDVPTYTESATPYRVDYSSSYFLYTDFVLVIKANGLDTPRVFAERHPNGSLAMQLTLVPKVDLLPIPAQEYIFIIDRSGSMSGSRIASAKDTLIMLLRALPSQETTFNIISFGDKCDGLWSKSQPYTEQALNYATQMIDLMHADYGGTEIRDTLKVAFKSRLGNVPTAYFLLTDGEAYDVKKTVETVSTAVGKAKTPLRVFTLGIGSTTSSAMCEGIARAGHGICLMAVTSESIVGKCSKLVRASRTDMLKNITVDWSAVDGSKKTQALRQAPQTIDSLYSGTRTVVFALIRPPTKPDVPTEKLKAPKEITLQAQQGENGGVLKFKFPVVEIPYKEDGPHLIHTLAARRIIQELTDGESTEKLTTARATITQLGTQYQLASPYTSFVVVDHEENPGRLLSSDGDRASSPKLDAHDPTAELGGSQSHAYHKPARHNTLLTLGGRGIAMIRHSSKSIRPLPLSRSLSTSSHSSPLPASRHLSIRMPAPRDHRPQSLSIAKRVFSKLGVQPTSAPSVFQPSGPAQEASTSSEQAPRIDISINKDEEVREYEYEYEYPPQEEYAVAPRAPAHRPKASNIVGLVRLQSFNGSFARSPELEKFVGWRALHAGRALEIDATVWATVLAVLYLKKHLADEPELLEGLVDKAMEFLSASPGVDIPTVMAYARSVVK